MCQGSYAVSVESLLSLPSFQFFSRWEIWEWKGKNREEVKFERRDDSTGSHYRLTAELNAH